MNTKTQMHLVLIGLLAFMASACATTGAVRDGATPPPHPLLGLKVQVSDLKVMTPSEVTTALSEARYLLLGEQHDNPAHHRVQARIVAEQAGADTHVVFEMLDDPETAERVNRGEDISGDWDKSGWPPFETYAPIFEALKATGASAQAGNPCPGTVKSVVRGRLEALDTEERDRLGLGKTLTEAELKAMHTEMVQAHCGHAHPGIDGMVDAQRFKDATMAQALRDAPARAILIAGRGHTRGDRGVPRFLATKGALSIALLGVEPGKRHAKDYLDRAPGADLLWFTTNVPAVDHCAAFRAHMKRSAPPK
ncbi:MAG: ChaN family lipoprotein [Myxococcota bacterium]